MGIVGALSEVCNLGGLEISAEYDLLLVIYSDVYFYGSVYIPQLDLDM